MFVKSERVPHPVAVRYGFENYVEEICLVKIYLYRLSVPMTGKTEKMKNIFTFLLLVFIGGQFLWGQPANLVWNTQSRNASESMPAGVVISA